MMKTKRDSKKVLLTTALLTVLIRLWTASSNALAETTNDEPDNDEITSQHTIIDHIKTTLDEIWQAPDIDVYLPIHTWHNRHSYTHQKISEYNEQPWGLGLGKYRYDQAGDRRGLYAMLFLDSNSDLEPIAGYVFQKNWHLNQSVKLGLGYTVGVTLRHETAYLPLPVVLPVVSVQYQSLALESTYVPGTRGNGNVLFTWIRWEM